MWCWLLTWWQEIVVCVEVVEERADGDWRDEPFGAAIVEVVGGNVDAD